jgi:ADP-ribose pyrophosphatase
VPEVEEAYAGPIFRVEVLRWPEKRRDVVRALGSTGVVALTAERDVILVRQEREAVGERLLEVPAGLHDTPGESPEGTGGRELEEEAGYRAATLEPLGRIHTSPGFVDEVCHLVLAEGCERVADPERGIEVVVLPLARALEAMDRGEITDAKTVAGLLLAARRER